MKANHAPTGGTQSAFLKHLVHQFRSRDPCGAPDGRSDWEILGPLILAPDEQQLAALSSEPDPDVFWRIELFYTAVGMVIEERTGVGCEPMLKMHHEGFGRLVLLAGRLVVLSRFLQEVQSFGFDSLERLAAAGERLVNEGLEMIEQFPGAAQRM